MKNILGTDLKCCGTKPMTGYFRDGFCRTTETDRGRHVVACIVNEKFLKFLCLFKSILVCHLVEAFLPKKCFLKSLSTPTTSKPFLQKKPTDSEPTNPLEPVIRTNDIKSIFSNYIYYL